MPGQPDWVDKWVSKATFGAVVRSPGTERTAEDRLPIDARPRPRRAQWTRRHGLLVTVTLVFVLPLVMAAVTTGTPRMLRLALIVVPSLVIAAILTWE